MSNVLILTAKTLARDGHALFAALPDAAVTGEAGVLKELQGG
ncbi:MAG TPA: hypothetical protein VK034_11170 [Enhygromyxa sp.]|nr:hypothetical protein [Enhygromyxa sp.]